MFLPMVVNIEPISRNRMNRRDIFSLTECSVRLYFFFSGMSNEAPIPTDSTARMKMSDQTASISTYS